MKVIIAGSRDIDDYDIIDAAVKRSGYNITEVVSGTARGPDKLGEEYAINHDIPIKKFPADWNYHGKVAGYIRNKEMGDYCDAAIILWDGKSKGTKNMIDIMSNNKNLKKFIWLEL